MKLSNRIFIDVWLGFGRCWVNARLVSKALADSLDLQFFGVITIYAGAARRCGQHPGRF